MDSRVVCVRRLALILAFLLIAVAVYAAKPYPQNIIFIIGDGMGVGAITGARCAGPGEDGKLILDTMPITGLVKVHAEDRLVPDSAASGTALATGQKTKNGRISIDSKGNTLPTILELAATLGKATGVITTDTLTSATPAVFYAHAESRGLEDDIAVQLIESPLTVGMGSGRSHFMPKSVGGSRNDERDLIVEAKQKGFEVLFDPATLMASQSKKLLGLFSFDTNGPTLEAMLNKTISVLAANPKGFFVMVESCLPDKGGHANNASMVLKGVSDLENALRCALEFAKRDKNTLVVVTADHDTGSLTVLDRDQDNSAFKPGWVGGGHTGNMVPLYAFGPGAEKFTGTHDNTDIPKIFSSLWGKKLGSNARS